MKPNAKLLKPLVTALRRLDKKDWRKAGFDMAHWARNTLPKTPDLGCGTQCCAYGLGTTLPSWKRAGLRLVGVGWDSPSWEPCNEAMLTLGLTEQKWNYIFSPSEYREVRRRMPLNMEHNFIYWNAPEKISPGQVADRIETILNMEHNYDGA